MTSDSGPTVASHRISGHVGGRKEPDRPYPHIDDILQVTPEGNTSQPLGHLLGIAENGVKFAKFQADVGNIDIALREYIKAYIIAVTIIPSHRDYTSIQIDRRHLGDRYNKLTKDLHDYADNYESIKQTIKADNAKTGVQRATQTSAHNGRPQTPKYQPKTPAVTSSPIKKTSSPAKAKPPVQPKPPNLSGKTIQKPGAGGKSDDLTQRFAKLRGPVQDPRIKTQPPPVPIPTEKPAGPREMPKKPPISLDGVGPVLPKLPDAIYSPARSNLSNEAAALPSSTPRGFSRQNSSLSSAAKSPPTQSNDYFGPITSAGPTSAPGNEKRRVPLPEGDIITVEEFVKYQRIGSKDFRILVIDVRSRPEFEDGHILSSATICIEPDILQRDRIEAADVEDAMELGPSMEKWHFERRHEFDMVVFYDHDSEHLSSGNTNAPATLFRLLTDFDYPDGDPASKHPKLLKGGLEAWQDAMGGSALQKSSKSNHRKRPSAYDWLRVRSPSKPIQSIEEARRWEDKLTQLRNDEAEKGSGDEFQPVRTLSDFMTRFPPVQESMSMTSPPLGSPTMDDNLNGRLSPGPIRSPPPRPMPQPNEFVDLIPVEPTRPPPTVPRRPTGGLQDTEDDHGTPNKLKKRSDAAHRKRAVGLENPTGAWCYANSTLQALFASGGFGEELMSGEWAQLYKAPMKSDENIQPPQLLTKILANLFHWMGHGKFPSMPAKTLMEYLRQKSSKNSQGRPVPQSHVLGSNRQQDAMEFFSYVFMELDDETNRFRNRPSEVPQPEPSRTKSLTDLAIQYWDLHSRVSDSIIDKYWRITEVVVVSCDHCGHVVTKYSNKDMQFLSLPHQSSHPVLMEDLLQKDYADELLEDYVCDNCATKGRCRKGTKLARLPDFLCVCFTRFEKDDLSGRFSKITTTVDFPIRELDLTPYTIQGSQANPSLLTNGNPGAMRSPASTIPTDDHHFNRPFKYEAYAVVQHGGELNSGHYVGIIRDEPHGPDGNSKWHVADDSRLAEMTVGPSRTDKGSQFLYKQDRHWGTGMQAFMVFYQRKDAELV